MNKFVSIIFLILSFNILSMPIDWNGSFGVDTTLIDNFRGIEQLNDQSWPNSTGDAGSQEVPLANGDQANASFQTYLLKLSPVMIVNDSATFKGEFSTGYGRGGRLGDDTIRSKNDNQMGNALYVQNSTGGKSLNVNKMYMELYADTATWVIGRHSTHWALGAIYNDGEKDWNRLAYVRDGLTLNFKLGNFYISPYWAKISSERSFTRATKVKEMGFSLLYDNPERDIAFGLLYGKKENSALDNSVRADVTDSASNDSSDANTLALGKTDVKITDIYFKKVFGDFTFNIEIPIISGELGDVYATGKATKYKAKAFIVDTNYQLTEAWKLSLLAGKVSGDSGGTSSFEAMYLHPNYQVANILFRYNYRAISDPDNFSIFDSYITNSTYLKLGATYQAQKWTWDLGAVYAKASEVALKNKNAFNHQTNKNFRATYDQADDLGFEFDLNVGYQWNNEVLITTSAGYLFTGDYYAYTNDVNNKNTADNILLLQMGAILNF